MLSKNITQIVFTLAVGLIGGLSANFILSQAGAANVKESIEASSFDLVDSKGNHRAGLGLDENENPVLVFKDPDGAVRAYFILTNNGPYIAMKNKDKNVRLYMRLDNESGPTVGLMNNNKPQLLLSLHRGVSPSVAFFDEQGKGRLALALSNGNPGLAFLDSRQQSQVLIQARDGQGALVSLHDGKNEPAVAMGLREGRSFVYAYDREKSGFFAGAQSGKGQALALKERGKVAWAAGAGGDVKALEQGLDATGFGMDLLR
ncbi:MAG: hypothetical protein V1797_16805 [Pseudomonadota bacterium]